MSQLSLIPHLLRHAEEHPQKVAFLGRGWTITYGDLEKRSRRIASHLIRAGIRRGHAVAIVLGRRIEAVESVLAITRGRAIGVPLDPRLTVAELTRVLEHSDARAIITESRHLATVRAAVMRGQERLIIVVAPVVNEVEKLSESWVVRYQDWAEDEECSISDVEMDNLGEDDPAFLHYTSGTTGSPKGVLSSQKNWLWSVWSIASVLNITPDDRFFWPLPLFHCLGHSLCIVATLAWGISAYLPDAEQTLLDSLLDDQARKTTIIVGAPATFHELISEARALTSMSTTNPLPLPLPGLRACMSAGAAAPVSLGVQVQEIFGVQLLNNYGCTEACGAITIDKPSDLHCPRPSGTLLPGMEAQVMNPDGYQVEDGKQGEAWIRSPSLMLGYYKETQTPFTADGWFPTGDIAVRSSSTAGMELNVVGRKKELIVRGGENIRPEEVEEVLLRCPGVADVVVAGIRHKILGETPAAFIVKHAPHLDLDLSALLAACRQALPDYKAPTAFYEMDAVPRTLLGKPRRMAVISCVDKPLSARSKLVSRGAVDALVLAETAAACAVEVRPGEESGPDWLQQQSDQPFAVLGLGSLASVVLRDRLASLTGLDDLPTTLVFHYSTPAAVGEYLHKRLLGLETATPPTAQPASAPAPGLAANGVVEPIAIISMACRYPGGIASPDDLWRLVRDEVDAIGDFPRDRGWNVDALYSPDPEAPGTSTTKQGGFLPDFADFDAGLFGMAPREALATDPQQRLLLETTWELAERGNIAPLSLRGSQTGVFIGILYDDYEENGFGNHELEAHLGLGSSGSVVSGRVSYCFGLHGPSLAVSTGCSSSLVAVHLAAQSLRDGESTLAIAGGVTTMATPRPFTMFSRRRGLSTDGRCRAYSSDAAGTGWSEGVSLILLERLSVARRNGHHVLGLIRGSAVNSDGASNGLTAPSGPAQQMVIQKALAQAALLPEDVDVLEGHGTATPLGDPIEVQAVISAYGHGNSDGNNGTRRSIPLLLGSIKSNIGHTQAAAAVAGIIKMVQSIRHGVAPASLHIREPSPHIKWEGSGVELLSKARQWPSVPDGNASRRPRRAAVSSFGIGGTNAHVILEQSNEPVEHEEDEQQEGTGLIQTKDFTSFPWLLSGADEAALRAQAWKLLEAWRRSPDDEAPLRKQNPADIAFTLATARSPLRYRATLSYPLGRDLDHQVQTALEAVAQVQPHPDVMTGHTSTSGVQPRLACLFSGQGSRMPSRDALEELRGCFPVFAEAFHAACDEVDQHLDCPLAHAIVAKAGGGGSEGSLLDRTDFSQAALFVFEVAMFRLLESFNVRPDLVAGHSLGEVAAAHIAGALCLRDAARIVTARGKLMATLPPNGGMVSIAATEEEVTEMVSQLGVTAVVAVVNSRKSVVLSGTRKDVQAVGDKFVGMGRKVTMLRGVRHAFHSSMMDSILSSLEQELAVSIEGGRPMKIPLVSTVTGKRASAEQLGSSRHWTRHASQRVLFADAVDELRSNEHVSVFVEVGPSAALSPHVPGAVTTHGQVGRLLNTLGQLWAQGVPVDWRAVFRGSGARLVNLPVYAFQRRRYWLDPPQQRLGLGAVRAAQPQMRDNGVSNLGHEVLFSATSIPGRDNILCSGYMSTTRQPWLLDHVIGGKSLVPATALAELALRAGRECPGCSESGKGETTMQVALDELTVIAPLALTLTSEGDESEEFEVQVLVGEPEPDAQGSETGTRRSVNVYSRPNGVAIQHEWTAHATGAIRLASPSNSKGGHLSNGAERPDEIDISKAYADLDKAGISYGPTFQRVRAIWSTTHDDELLVQIDPPQGQKSAFVLHPALLDAALHALLLAAPEKVAGDDIRLPFSIRGMQVFAASSTTDPIIARILHNSEDNFSVTLTDKATGAPVAEMAEVMLRRWQPSLGDFYRLEWTRSTSTGHTTTTTPSTTNEIIRLQCSSSETVIRAVHNAVAEALRVVHKWRAGKTYAAGGRLVMVTKKAVSLSPGDDVPDHDVDVVAAAVWGFVRSAQAEFGGDRIVLIDLDGSDESEAALPRVLASREEVVALRDGTTMIPSLRKLPATTSGQNAPDTSTLDVSGTVLITGGTGGLGALLSRHIVRAHGAKHLLLVSRSGLEAPGAHQLCDELRDEEAAVRVEACDCSDRAQLAALLVRSHDFPPISAVIHCAGVVDDAVLGAQTPQRMSRVLRPKVDAAWHLHELVSDTVRSFVLFSSYVGALGNEGQASYTAGNCFLDALACVRVARGLPALSLAWGPWANDVGMAAGSRLAMPNPRLANAQPFTEQQGLQMFDRALQTPTHKPPKPVLTPLLLRGSFPLVPSNARTASFRTGEKSARNGKSGALCLWRVKLSASSPESRGDVLMHLMRDEIAAVLGYQGQDMLLDKPFADLGFDSFTSVLLTNRLRVLTGLNDLPVTLALDYDTTQELVQYLCARLEVEPAIDSEVLAAALEEAGEPAPRPAGGDHGLDNGTTDGARNGLENGWSSSTRGDAPGHEGDVKLDVFRGLASLHKRLCELEKYTAAADLLASASLALPTFKMGPSLSSHAAAPQQLAAGPPGSSALPIVFIAPFFPRIKIDGVGLSVYSFLASGLNGDRDVFELPHPEGCSVPYDLKTLTELHVVTIREFFADKPGIILAGYSAGGTITHAVASKLSREEDKGQKVALKGVVLIDTYLSMTGRGDPDWLNALPAEALVSRLGSPTGGNGGAGLVGDLDLALAKVGGYFRTLRDWNVEQHPLPASLSTLFVRALHPASKMPKDAEIWRPQWPRADLKIDVPGSHLELLDKRYAAAIATELKRWAREDLKC